MSDIFSSECICLPFQGSWGSKKDLSPKDFLTLSIMTAVTGRKRRKRHNARRVGSSTDDDSEHEPIRRGHLGAEEEEEEMPGGGTAPRAEGEEDEEEDEEVEVVGGGLKEEAEEEAVQVVSSRPQSKEEVGGGGRPAAMLQESRREAKGPLWRAPEDARSVVSGYSTLSTLGRSLGSMGRGEEADDEHSELVSETDNESGFASRSLTQERPDKEPRSPPPAIAEPPRSFLYTHIKVPPATGLLAPPPGLAQAADSVDGREGGARSSTPSSSSFSSSSTTQKLHSRPSFNSHKLIQCDTLARKKLKSEKAKARSLDLMELSGGGASADASASGADSSVTSRTHASSGSSQEKPRLAPPRSSQGADPGRSLADQVRARLLGSADDLRSVGLRKPLSPETRRKRRAWRRHTVVASPTEVSDKRPPVPLPLSALGQPQSKVPGLPQDPEGAALGAASRHPPTSRFHQYL